MNVMKIKFKKSIFSLLMVALVLSSCALPGASGGGKLQVSAKHPETGIQQGQVFDLELQLINPDNVNATVKEIRFESDFFEWASYEGSIPPLSMETQANGDGVIKLDMTIAPTGVEDFVFRFRANKSGDVLGNWRVVAGSSIIAIETRMKISGTTPTGWDPGVSPEGEAPDLGAIPYQAVVQITAFVDIDGETVPRWTGSGTIISSDGLILTNDHVVSSTRYEEVVALLVSLTVAQDQPPVDSYYAYVVQADASLDLAVIKPAWDMKGNPLDYSQLRLPFVPLGDSDTLDLGESIVILGYPVIGGGTITLTRGEVSGFTSEEPFGNRAFIKTSGTIAGGNSGGLAVDSLGQIVGIPTQLGSGDLSLDIVDCRPVRDTNRDGYIDENDDCVPTGGFINALRPINLARNMIDAAKRGEVTVSTGDSQNLVYQNTGDIIFEDDFANTDSGWLNTGDADGRRAYENGEYTIEVTSPMYWFWSDQYFAYDALMAEADVRVVKSVGDADYGFVCGMQGDEHFVALEISEDGYFTIWKQAGEEFSTLIDWTYSEQLAGSGPYRLAVQCSREKLALAVDGILLGEVQDPDYLPGGFGMIAGTFDNGGFKVAFDNLIIMIP
ncbi:MAG TPA: serine protease [Anaerolineaceae bacterium]|nr:serine protease [Anaerolineaceae bacterium]